MFIQSLKYDYQTAGILVEYVTKSEARQMSSKLIKAIFEKGGELHKFEGFIGGVYTVENYLLVGTDLGADQLDQIIEFIKSAADPDQYDENDYEQKETNEDFSMGVSGPTGLNQGIPHGGPGKGVLPKPLFDPKAKAVPAKEEDDKDTEENLKKLRDAKKLLKTEGYVLKRANAAPLMDQINQFENYLHDKYGFTWGEIDDLVDTNKEMIEDKLKLRRSFANIAAYLDASCLNDIED